ncbi:MAG: hypothetical protein JW728_07755, partial [Candidatus Aureabacteria bacterium]|nr:hypothetical protein [Candidatus Auribacterota bacterium]
GDDGMEFYRRIMQDARFFLKKGGHLVCEIGYNQASKVTGIATKNSFSHISIIKDYNGKDRVACFRT